MNILKYFSYQHLPAPLQIISEPFGTLANHLNCLLPDGQEKEICLRKLLEAKDCAVRSSLEKQP